MSTLWEKFLTEEDRAVLARGKFGRRMGFGQRPAVLVIDAQRYMVGAVEDEKSWPSSCGEVGRESMRYIAQIVQTAQQVEVPCIFTRFEIDPSGADMGVYRRKRDLLQSEKWCLAGTLGAELSPLLVPAERDLVFVKKKPSGFHGTPLLGYLIDRGIDTVIVVGGATSNCVRATVFDCASFNYRAIVPQEAVFDRIPISHAMSLFYLDRQFADVLPATEVMDYLSACRGGRFDSTVAPK
jgi:nicotinamidase-related amidase